MNKNNKKPVAVFDIDGTLFRSSLLIELVELLMSEGIFPKSAQDDFRKEYSLWVDRKGSYQEYINKVISTFHKNIKGVSLDDVSRLADKLLENHQYKVYRFSRDLIDEVRDSHFLLTISHSPRHVVEPFAKAWGFDEVYAKIYSVDENNYFTGGIDDDDLMMQKDKVLLRAVEKRGLTLEGSVGIGDTESDAVFLDLVSRPIAFNPNGDLYKIAKKKGWEIVVERKDVVYNIN